jgi:hypothetical protein
MLINKSVFLIIHTVTNGTEELKSKFHMLPCCMAPRLDFLDYKVSLSLSVTSDRSMDFSWYSGYLNQYN